jgi:hypothetical protein
MLYRASKKAFSTSIGGPPKARRHGSWILPRARAIAKQRRVAELGEMGDTDAAAEQLVSALTHRAWTRLLSVGVLPASRAELPKQLHLIDQDELAAKLQRAIEARQSVFRL